MHDVLVQRLLQQEHEGTETDRDRCPLVIDWTPPKEGSVHAKLYAVFRDRSSSLSSICSILSDLKIDISEALVFCTTDGIAVDTFLCASDDFDIHDPSSYVATLETLERNIIEQLTRPVTDDTPPRSAMTTPVGSLGDTSQSQGESTALNWPWDSTQRELWHEKQFADLTLTRFCAEGSDSKVWEASWGVATVAVKVLKDEPNIGKDSLKCFMSEVEIWRRLRHPHICAFMGTVMQDGRPAMVLEFMQGGSLHSLLHGKKSRPLEPAKKGCIALEVASGLAYLHSQGILHRDIKTANILLDEQQHAKVADFGISRTFGGELTAETGTYRTMAPEVITHQQYCSQCDVYSFGVLLWELTHQLTPFADFTPLQAAFAVAMEQRRPDIALSKELEAYGPLIKSCWKQNPDDRPSSDKVVVECKRLRNSVAKWSPPSSSRSIFSFLSKPAAK